MAIDSTPGTRRARSRISCPGRACSAGVGERGWGKRRARGQNVVDVDAGVERSEAQHGPAEHSGGDQEHDGEGDFGDDEGAVQARARIRRGSGRRRGAYVSRSRAGARRAGASPKRRPLSEGGGESKQQHVPSSWTSSARGRPPGQKVTKGRMPRAASATPSSASGQSKTALSVRHWRTRRPRPAPRATRMASSRSRDTARASRRLAILAQAISSTRLTAPSRSHSVERTSPTSGRSGSAKNVRPSLDFGNCAARRRPTMARSDCAWEIVAPGRSRAQTLDAGWASRLLHEALVVLADGGEDVDLVIVQRRKSAGVTPTMV